MAAAASDETAAPAPVNTRRRLLLIGVPVLLSGTGAALWFGGVLPPLFGMGGKSRSAGGEPAGSADAARQGRPAAAGGAGTKDLPVFVELPEMISNLNVMPGRRASFVKLRARLELARAEDGATVTAVMPRLLDLFQTYLREMRPEELRGSMGTWRLREELIARANLAVAPARVTDVLFTELLVQ